MILYRIRKLIAKWKYRKVPDGLCGCGVMMDEHGIDYSHTPVDIKQYYIEQYAKGEHK